MIVECMARKINMVITKSISRFAKNTLDCLKYIRQLKDRNIPVFLKRECQYHGFQRKNAADHHGIVGIAGESVLKPECETRTAVPIPVGTCASQS